jgi:hypothetical protein
MLDKFYRNSKSTFDYIAVNIFNVYSKQMHSSYMRFLREQKEQCIVKCVACEL